MLKNIQGDSWGSIPPLRISSLLPHDLCHGWRSSLRLPAANVKRKEDPPCIKPWWPSHLCELSRLMGPFLWGLTSEELPKLWLQLEWKWWERLASSLGGPWAEGPGFPELAVWFRQAVSPLQSPASPFAKWSDDANISGKSVCQVTGSCSPTGARGGHGYPRNHVRPTRRHIQSRRAARIT